MEDDLDADLDTHKCLKCETIIIGLSNYVQHRRQLCPAILVKPADVAPKVDQTSSSQPSEAKEANVKNTPKPDEFFFSSLELQSKTKTTSSTAVQQATSSKDKDKDAAKLRQLLESSEVHGDRGSSRPSRKRKVVVRNEDYELFISDEEDDVEDEEDDDDFDDVRRPPRGHTGGKWKPVWMPPDGAAVAATSSTFTTSSQYRCAPCDLTTNSEESLVQHLMDPSHWKDAKSHPDHEALVLRYSTAMAAHAPFRCDICKFYFNQLEHLVGHWARKRKLHTSSRFGFQCSLCSASLKSSRSVVEHLKNGGCKTPLAISAMSREQFPCSSCSYVARTAAAKDAHEKRSHAKVKQISAEGRACRVCNVRFSNLTTLRAHVTKEHPGDLFTCKWCDQLFFCKSQQYKHSKRCGPKKTTSHRRRRSRSSSRSSSGSGSDKKRKPKTGTAFKCGVCDEFSCDVKAELLYHETLHTEAVLVVDNEDADKDLKKPAQLYSCPECQQLQPKRGLLLHLLEHTGEKPYKCKVCNKDFVSRNSLYQHGVSNHSEKKFACPHCDFKTYKKFRLNRHLGTHQILRPRPHLCEMCGADFLERYALRYHMKLHVDEKSQKCSFEGCNKSYRSMSELIVHMRTHTDERPFLCTECGYGAKTRHQLTKHERKHNGQRPFKCPHCPYAAKLSAQLWRHVRTHTGVRPYSCPHCTYTCNTSENLRKHVLKSKKHPGLKIYICPYCADFGCNHVKEFHDHVINNHKETIHGSLSVVTPTYLSLLSGVYDKNAAAFDAKDFEDELDANQTSVDGRHAAATTPVAVKVVKTSACAVVDAQEVELRESLAFLKATTAAGAETDDNDEDEAAQVEAEAEVGFRVKIDENAEEITMVSIQLVEEAEETTSPADQRSTSGLEGQLLEDAEATLLTEDSEPTMNTDSNTIVIYLPMD